MPAIVEHRLGKPLVAIVLEDTVDEAHHRISRPHPRAGKHVLESTQERGGIGHRLESLPSHPAGRRWAAIRSVALAGHSVAPNPETAGCSRCGGSAVSPASCACRGRPAGLSAAKVWSLRGSLHQRGAHQRQAVVAEVHVITVDKHRGRAETAAADQFLGVGLELILDLRPRDAGKEFRGVDAAACTDTGQHFVPGNVFIPAPIGFEGRAGEVDQPALRRQPQAAAHGLDAVDREHCRWKSDGNAAMARPVLHVFQLVGGLGRHRVVARGVHAGVDAVEHPAHEDRLPTDGHPRFGGQWLDVVEGQEGPGAGDVEVEIDHVFTLACHPPAGARRAKRES